MIRFIRIKIYGNTFKNSLRRRGSKVIFITIKICSASYIVLNRYLLKVEMNLGHAHKTRFWYLFVVFSKISDKRPRHFYRRLHTPPPPFRSEKPALIMTEQQRCTLYKSPDLPERNLYIIGVTTLLKDL